MSQIVSLVQIVHRGVQEDFSDRNLVLLRVIDRLKDDLVLAREQIGWNLFLFFTILSIADCQFNLFRVAASADIVITLFATHVARILVHFEDLLIALLTPLATASLLSLVRRLELIFGQRLQCVLLFASNQVRVFS